MSFTSRVVSFTSNTLLEISVMVPPLSMLRDSGASFPDKKLLVTVNAIPGDVDIVPATVALLPMKLHLSTTKVAASSLRVPAQIAEP